MSAFFRETVTELAMKYFVVVNALCIPFKEYEEKKSWYDFFVAKKDETEMLISNSSIFIAKVEEFLKEKEVGIDA